MVTRLNKFADQVFVKCNEERRLKVARSKLATAIEILEMLVGYLPVTNIGSHGLYEEGRPRNIEEVNYDRDTKAQKVRDTLILGIQRAHLYQVENYGATHFVPAEVIGYVMHEGCGVPEFLARYGRKWRMLNLQGSPPVAQHEGLAPTGPDNGTLAAYVFPTPDGAKWDDVHIRFTNGDAARLRLGDVEELKTAAELGMADGRNKCPNVQFKLLYDIANGNGKLSRDCHLGSQKAQRKTVNRLRADLRRIFGITQGDPIKLLPKYNGWETTFHTRPE